MFISPIYKTVLGAFSFWLISLSLAAQNVTPVEKLVVGTWVQRLDAASDVAAVPRNLFIFEPDHRFTRVPETAVADTLPRTTGTWEVTDTHLTLSPMTADTMAREPIIWVNDNLFYTTGQQDAEGASVFAYFQRVTGQVKRRLRLKQLLKQAKKP